jgi:hypothetical protein
MPIIDDTTAEVDHDYQQLRQVTKKYLRITLLLIIINSLLYAYHVSTIALQLPLVDAIALGLLVHFLGVGLIGLMLSLFIAFIPYQKLSWQQKYRSVTVGIIFLINGIIFIRKCNAILFFHTGWSITNVVG